MATVTLTATNYSTTNVATVTNASNAYTDTTSSTYAQVTTTSSSSSKAYFYGFDFSQIPSGVTIDSVAYKIKVKTVGSGGSTFYVFLENRNTSSALSAKTSTASTTSETVVTLTPTSATWSDIVAMGDNFAFCVQHSRTTRTQNVYGMEIDVTYTIPYVPNKVVYGGNTLIDLTADTVTAADVLSGVTFHLPSGVQATGTASAGASLGIIERHSAQNSTSSSSYVTFSGLSGEPQAFVAYTCWDIDGGTVGSSLYVGTSAYVITTCCYDGNGISANIAHGDTNYPLILRNNKYYQAYPDITFSYSNGSLTLNGGGTSSSTGSFYLSSNNIFRLIYVY